MVSTVTNLFLKEIFLIVYSKDYTQGTVLAVYAATSYNRPFAIIIWLQSGEIRAIVIT